MNETRTTTATGCLTLFDKGHGVFYMPRHIDTAGMGALDYPVMGTGFMQIARLNEIDCRKGKFKNVGNG